MIVTLPKTVTVTTPWLIILISCCFHPKCATTVHGLQLLSDLPTPSFLIDTKALEKASGSNRPPHLLGIRLPKHGVTLVPTLRYRRSDDNIRTGNDNPPSSSDDATFDLSEEQHGNCAAVVGYLHSSVIRAREDVSPDTDHPVETFLAEIDLPPSLCASSEDSSEIKESTEVARLVMGLSNHHVGSYYWARSEGAGSSTEAPGVQYAGTNNDGFVGSSDCEVRDRGILRWADDRGPMACNSNDGKRSEWLNFLRVGDTVQLLPSCGQDAIFSFIERYGMSDCSDSESEMYSSIRVFGVSSKGRPLGSEAAVVCEWTCEKI